MNILSIQTTVSQAESSNVLLGSANLGDLDSSWSFKIYFDIKHRQPYFLIGLDSVGSISIQYYLTLPGNKYIYVPSTSENPIILTKEDNNEFLIFPYSSHTDGIFTPNLNAIINTNNEYAVINNFCMCDEYGDLVYALDMNNFCTKFDDVDQNSILMSLDDISS